MPSTVATDPQPPALTWQLRLLGQPALVLASVAAGSQRCIVLRPKDAALLAVVALAGPLKAERLAALLWPAASARQADTSLRQRLFRLRRETQAALITSGALLQLAPGLVTDLGSEIERIAADEHAGQSELLGDLDYDDLPDLADWLRAQRSHWHEQRDAALAAAAADCESQDRKSVV